MKLIFKLAVRNLLRQKRRNMLLGLAMAFGMMILVIANSFSHGISDTLINRIVVLMTGHIDVAMVEKGNVRAPFMREKKRMEEIIRANVTGIKRINENLGMMARIIGNGKSDNCWMVGLSQKDYSDFKDHFNTLSGDIFHIFNQEMVNPCVISKNKAELLNVKLHDTLRARMQNIHGQQQSGILTIAAIVESSNMFNDFASFLSVENVKKLRGLRDYETGSLQIILEHPETAIQQADKLHSVFEPGFAYIPGFITKRNSVAGGKNRQDCVTIGFFRDQKSKELIREMLVIPENQIKKSLSKKGVIISQALQNELQLKVGDYITQTHKNRYEDGHTARDFKVTGIIQPSANLPSNVILMSDKLFYKLYYNHLPKIDQSQTKTVTEGISPGLLPALSKEWMLLKRSPDFNEMKKKFKDFMRKKTSVSALDIRTMHETASNIVKLEKVLNLITFMAVIILFFIILIGVVNTLRMSIKERTREIGTVRAIGMRRNDVRYLMIVEAFLLALISTIVGTIAAFIIMGLSQFWEIHVSSFINILLVDHKLYFVPNLLSIVLNMMLILFITVVTAYFPSKNAANKVVADALRHFD